MTNVAEQYKEAQARIIELERTLGESDDIIRARNATIDSLKAERDSVVRNRDAGRARITQLTDEVSRLFTENKRLNRCMDDASEWVKQLSDANAKAIGIMGWMIANE